MATLSLTVLSWPEYGSAEQRLVRGGELTLGRDNECDWTLPDPLKSLSRKHCKLELVSGAWQVRDLSANGTFLNAVDSPIGRNQAQLLRDGDRLRLGDYEIEVRVADEPEHAQPRPFGLDALPHVDVDALRPSFSNSPLPGLDNPVDFKPPGAPGPASPSFGTMSDHEPSSSDAYVPPPVIPAGNPIVPDDWYASIVQPPLRTAQPPLPPPLPPSPPPPPAPTPATALPRAPSPASSDASPFDLADLTPAIARRDATERLPRPAMAPAHEPRVLPAPTPAAAPRAVPGAADMGAAGAWAALLAGAELPPERVARAPAESEASLRNAGALLRSAIGGIRALLIARGMVKREFRIEQTMLRTKENNPLKFSASDEQALAALLEPRANALAAMQESVEDLSSHQVAVMAATQAAARALMERLDPSVFEDEDAGGGLFSDSLEKRLWEAYKRRHAKLLEQFEDDFESAFGTAFARAYEQAIGQGKD